MSNPRFPLIGVDSSHNLIDTLTDALAGNPVPTGGILTQFSWQEIDEFATSLSDMESGESYAYSYNHAYDSGNLRPLRCYKLTFESIEKVELDLLEGFFNSQLGRLGIFDLYDGQGNLLAADCRFDQDSMIVKYPAAGKYSTEFYICRPLPMPPPA